MKDTELKSEVAVIKNDVKWIKKNIEKWDKTFVTKAEFRPVQKIVYAAVGIVLTAFLAGLIVLVINTG